MRVVCISDTHSLHNELLTAQRIPDGDVLIHAGDFTDTGDRDEVLAFNAFLGTLPHKYKLVIAGNHESTFDRAFYPFNWQHYGHDQQYDPDEVRALLTNALYLEDQAVLIDGYKFYGSPWQPEFCNWAFNLPRGDKLLSKWQAIPSDTDVLITHTPPYGRGDQVGHLHVGCEDLAREVSTRIQPQFHVFGHVHEGYGKSSDGTTVYMNASSCTHEYDAVNAPFVFDLRVAKAMTGPSTSEPVLEYARMLHEQLRVCSQKVPFVPRTTATAGAECATTRRVSLREFRVDGTTSALLLESTLKLRPVVGEQTRARRYLFRNGVTGRTAGAAAVAIAASSTTEAEATGLATGASGSLDASAAPAGGATVAQRRQMLAQRRVTMAVLHDVSESKELTDAELQELEMSASTLTSDTAQAPAAATGRARRSKTLQRREGRVRLASTPEEPEEKPAAADQTPEPVPSPPAPPASETVSPPPAPPAVECVLCKYKVPGHVHPGSVPVADAPLAPPAAAAAPPSVGLSASSSVSSGTEPPEPATSTESARQKTIGSSRLSSWF